MTRFARSDARSRFNAICADRQARYGQARCGEFHGHRIRIDPWRYRDCECVAAPLQPTPP